MTTFAPPRTSSAQQPLFALRFLLTALGALAFGVGIGAVIAAIVATQFFGFRVLSVSSNSMSPAISSGDLIVVRPVAIDRVKERDIVLFTAGGDNVPTVHRVVGINELETVFVDRAAGTSTSVVDYRLVTQGDNNAAPDNGEIEAGDLKGRVWFTIPNAGVIAGAGLGLWFAVALAAVVATWFGWELAAKLRRRSTEVAS